MTAMQPQSRKASRLLNSARLAPFDSEQASQARREGGAFHVGAGPNRAKAWP